MPKSTPSVPRICEYCGASFFAWPSVVAQGKGRWCSKPCARRGHAEEHAGDRPAIPHPTDPTAMLVPLTHGKFAIIDAIDADRVSARKWRAKHEKRAGRDLWYAEHLVTRDGKQQSTLLHRFIVGALPGELVDHADGDGLNCRRENLRRATNAENTQNQRIRRHSANRFKGVKRVKNSGRWFARLRVNGRQINSPAFATEQEAARAYDDLAREHHGAFARLNFPREGERSAA